MVHTFYLLHDMAYVNPQKALQRAKNWNPPVPGGRFWCPSTKLHPLVPAPKRVKKENKKNSHGAFHVFHVCSPPENLAPFEGRSADRRDGGRRQRLLPAAQLRLCGSITATGVEVVA